MASQLQQQMVVGSLVDAFKALIAKRGSMDANTLSLRMATTLLEYAVYSGSSDILLDPHADQILVRFRIDGELRDQLNYPKSNFPIVASLRVMANLAPAAAANQSAEDGRFRISVAGRSVQFRLSSFPSVSGDRVVLRVLDLGASAPSLDNLGLAPEILVPLKKLVQASSGAVIVCGMTGSGKTTTLSSILGDVRRPEVNVMTLEDPVEYELPGVIHAQVNPKGGFTFSEGLRSILRQSPNVIMVGEIRDAETAETALQAALTGHMIFSTIHTTTAVGVIHRLASMGIEPYLIATALTGALAQRLLRRVCSQCAEPVAIDGNTASSWLRNLETSYAEIVRNAIMRSERKAMRGKGCEACSMTGYRGRVGIFELLIIDGTMRSLIHSKANVDELRRAAIASGMKTLLLDAIGKVMAGVTTIEELGRITAEN